MSEKLKMLFQKIKEYFDENKTKLLPILRITALVMVILILVICFIPRTPTLSVKTPNRVSLENSDTFTVNVLISKLGEALYPAMSVSLDFDASKLEFLGLREGNVFVMDNPSGVGVSRKLPEWNVNIPQSNKTGRINIMYLDLTGGRYAFNKNLLGKSDNALLVLEFRLRGSARAGDNLSLKIADAVFAALDEKDSLALDAKTLKVKDGKIIVGG